MAVAIRGTTPGIATTVGNPVSLTLNGTRQPNSDDVLIIIHCNDYYNITNMPTPTVGGSSTGVTSIVNADAGDVQGHAKSWYYVVGSTGDRTVAVTETGSADEEKALIVYVLSGVDTASPVDASAGGADTDGNSSVVAPACSPTQADSYLICHASGSPSSDWGAVTPPSGMAESYDAYFNSALHHTGATLQLSASGSTGTKTFTTTNLPNYAAVVSIAVKTAAGGGGGEPSIIRRPAVVAP